MIWWWVFILVMVLTVIIMLSAAAWLAGGDDVFQLPKRLLAALRNRLGPVLSGVSTSVTVYAIPFLIEWMLLKSDFNPWLVCVFLADFPGALLLYGMGYRKTAMVTYTATTLLEAALLSNGIMPRQVMMLDNVAPAIALGIVIAWRSTSHREARI